MPLAEMPLSNKQHAVPQNIMDVEFKLVGDLTMRQFAYLLVFGILSYLSTVTVVGLFKWPITVFLALLALGLAFIPFQERGLDEWIVNFIRSVYFPTQRVWHKEPTIPTAFLQDNLNVVKQELITLAPTSSRRRLEEYLKYQETATDDDPLDIPERKYAMKVHEAYAGVVSVPSQGVPTSVSVTYEEPAIVFPPLPQQDMQLPAEEPQEQVPEKKPEMPKVEVAEVKNASTDATVQNNSVVESIVPTATVSAMAVQQPTQQPVVAAVKPVQASPAPVTPTVATTSAVTPVVPVVSAPAAPKNRPLRIESTPNYENYQKPIEGYVPITPDMHSGRKFTNLLPESGELILPIRGERVIRSVDEVDVENDIKAKAERLQELLKSIKEKEGIHLTTVPRVAPQQRTAQVVTSPVETPEKDVSTEATDVEEKLKAQNEDLNNEIQKLKDEITAGKTASKETSSQESLLKRLEIQRNSITDASAQLSKQIQDLQSKIDEKVSSVASPQVGSTPSFARMQPLTNNPNTLSGVVRSKEGKGMENVLLIIKNDRRDPVRAIKTNAIGQFILTSPLVNGSYTIEVSPIEGKDLTFDIISVQLKGELVPPMEFISK